MEYDGGADLREDTSRGGGGGGGGGGSACQEGDSPYHSGEIEHYQPLASWLLAGLLSVKSSSY